MNLISSNQLGAIQRVSERGMSTEVEIFRRGPADLPPPQDDYGDDVEYEETTESTTTVVRGWLRSIPTQEQDVDSGAIVTTNSWVLRVPVGTDIQTGDEVRIDGSEYTVQGTDSDNTLLPFITCDLRRRE